MRHCLASAEEGDSGDFGFAWGGETPSGESEMATPWVCGLVTTCGFLPVLSGGGGVLFPRPQCSEPQCL